MMDDRYKSKTVWMCVSRKPNGQRSQLSDANSSNRRSKVIFDFNDLDGF